MAFVTRMRGCFASLQLANVATALASRADRLGGVQTAVMLPALGGESALGVASELLVSGGAAASAASAEAVKPGSLRTLVAAGAPA